MTRVMTSRRNVSQKSKNRNLRRPLAWLCRDYYDDPSDPFYPVVCRSKLDAVAVTKAQGYSLPPIPVYE